MARAAALMWVLCWKKSLQGCRVEEGVALHGRTAGGAPTC